MIDALVQDLRYAIRELASNRAAAGLAALCLSLAIGTNTTVFTFVNALLLRPLPLAAPDQLVSIHESRRDDPATIGAVSYPNFLDLRARVSDAGEIAAQRPVDLRVSDGGAPERYSGALVSWNFFAVLGVQPARGRGFLEEEDGPGGAPVVLLSHIVWQQHYAEDPEVVGRVIAVNGIQRTVIGIMPPDLSNVAMQRVLRGARLWIPIGSAGLESARDQRRLTVFGRLGNGETLDTFRARLSTAARTLEQMQPVENGGWTISVQPLNIGFSPATRGMILTMMGAVTFVLLIACANVATLTLSRTTRRRRDIATRLALGAPRSRILGQLLTESLLVALASLPFGIALAYAGRSLLLAGRASPELAASIAIDHQVLIFTAGLGLMASLLSGLLPALHAVRRVRYDVLKEGAHHDTSGPPHTRLSHALIVGEVALALILLVSAALLMQSFRNLLDADGGFDTSQILAGSVEVAEDGVEVSASASLRVSELVETLEALPGVTNAAAANLMPLRDGGVRAAVIPDQDGVLSGNPPTVLLGSVTAGFFEVLNVPIVQGRAFTDVEGRSRSAVAIVNTTMARRLWPNEDAIGRRFRPASDRNGVWFTVVGVAEGILTWDLSNRILPAAYLPYPYIPEREPRLLLRTAGDPALVAPSVRAAINAFDPAMAVLGMRTMTEIHYDALSRQETLADLLAVLGGIALLLAATGVYGVLSYFVSQRKYEIGIRAALGADRRSLVRLFVRQGMSMTLGGTVLGLAGASALARVLRGRLHEVSPTDPVSFAGAALLLVGIAVVASYLPGRRAASVDPLVAIREP